jgi:DNA-binding response OmpR family regulator
VIESFTTDHAVAVCVNNRIDAVILDQGCFVETDGWSVAQSVKAAKPRVCVLLVSPSKRLSKRMPKGVDAMVGADDNPQVLSRLESLLGKAS